MAEHDRSPPGDDRQRRIGKIDMDLPSAPALASPSDGATLATDTPAFDWGDVSDPSGVTYRIQIDNDPDFSSPEADESGLTLSEFTLTTTLAEGDYVWRVKVTDGAGNSSEWPQVWSFMISLSDTSDGGNGGGGSGCFIATATYGGSSDPNVIAPKVFKDDYLPANPAGCAFAKVYYAVSPAIVDFISWYGSLRVLSRLILSPILYPIRYLASGVFLLVLVFIGGIVISLTAIYCFNLPEDCHRIGTGNSKTC